MIGASTSGAAGSKSLDVNAMVTHVAMWAMSKAPMIIGGSLNKLKLSERTT